MKILKSAKRIKASLIARNFIEIMIDSKNLHQYSNLIIYFRTLKSSFFSAELSYQISPFCGDPFKFQSSKCQLMPDLNQ